MVARAEPVWPVCSCGSMPGDVERLEQIGRHLTRTDDPITANTDEELARATLKRGAFDFITKPFNIERLKSVLEAALAS
jgi:FixJ family two-component response regulator